jgi:hypothetical protein
MITEYVNMYMLDAEAKHPLIERVVSGISNYLLLHNMNKARLVWGVHRDFCVFGTSVTVENIMKELKDIDNVNITSNVMDIGSAFFNPIASPDESNRRIVTLSIYNPMNHFVMANGKAYMLKPVKDRGECIVEPISADADLGEYKAILSMIK